MVIILITKEMQIKVAKKYHLASIRTAKKYIEDVENLEPSYLCGNYVKYFSSCQKWLAVPQKVKYRIIVHPSNFTSKYILKKTKNRYSNKYIYRHIHSSTIHNSQKVKNNLNVHK